MIKLFIIFYSLFLSHPVHVSMSSLYINNIGEIELSLRMYSDDLALDLYRVYDAEGEYSEIDHMFVFNGDDSYYSMYAEDHLKVFFDGKLVEKELLRKEILDLETLLYFRIKTEDHSPDEIKIQNSVLADLYPDQVNLFIFKLFNREEGVKFTMTKTETKFLLDKKNLKVHK